MQKAIFRNRYGALCRREVAKCGFLVLTKTRFLKRKRLPKGYDRVTKTQGVRHRVPDIIVREVKAAQIAQGVQKGRKS